MFMVKKRGRKISAPKKFNLTKEYKKSWAYIKESKNFIYIIIGIFLFFVLFGFFIPAPKFLYDQIMNFIKELVAKTNGMSQSQLIIYIMSNNIQTTLSAIILGTIFGIFPLIDAIANGYLLGFVSLLSVNNGGIITLWRLFPHGIFELPAVFLSLGFGLKIGMFIFQKNKVKYLKNNFINSLRVFLLIIIPLLIIAGIIEGSLMVLLK